jgi:hypothetical protein
MSVSVEVERSGKYCSGLWPNAAAIFSLLEAHPWGSAVEPNTLDTASFSFFLSSYYYLLEKVHIIFVNFRKSPTSSP